jgi:cystathionine beta-synthase
VARRAKEGEVVVVLIPDTGERYLSKVHSDEWMRDNRLLDTGTVTVAEVLRGKGTHVPALVSVNFDEPVARALGLIREFNISQLPVLKDGAVVGSVSEGFLFQKVFDGSAPEDARVEYHLEKPLPTVPADATLPQVFKLLAGSNAALATDAHGKPLGILTRYDLLEYVAG